MKELKKRVSDLINEENMNKIVQKNFVETLNVYKEYFEEHKSSINLDIIKETILNKKRKRNKWNLFYFADKCSSFGSLFILILFLDIYKIINKFLKFNLVFLK